MLNRLLILALIGSSFPVAAATIHAEARAATEQQAKREALVALADSILVNVQSESSSYVEGSGKRQEALRISSRSDIPLIGVDITTVNAGAEVVCEASLDSGKSLALYDKKLNELLLEIASLDQRIANAAESDRYELLTQALTDIEQYEKYRAVAELLGETKSMAPPRNRADTEAQLRALERSAPSIELAAQVLTKGMKADAAYIYPAVPYGSHEVTPFARVMRDRIAQRMPSVDSPEKTQTYFKGEYEILDSGIHLTYRLLDTNGNTLETRVATLSPAAYKGLQVKPATADFDRLLHEGVAVSSDFRAQITTNRGSEDVLFDEKDEVELMVKLNRPGYFYIVGYVVKKSENYSYLLEMEHADNDRRFVRYVNADDVNKWLSIGRFTVEPPFGVESLQIMASSDDPIDRLPTHPLDNKSELYVTASNAKQGIINRQFAVLSTMGFLFGAMATPVLAMEGSDSGQRVIEETLVLKDPTVSAAGKWVFGGAVEELYTHGPYWSTSSSGDGQKEHGTVSASKPGVNLFAGYGDFTINYSYRKGSLGVDLDHTATSTTPFTYTHHMAIDETENELNLRWRLSSLDTAYVSPYVYLGYIDVKSDQSDTLPASSGLIWTYNGTRVSSSTTTYKGGMAGIGAIIPVSAKYGLRIDGGLTGTNATWTRSDGATATGSGVGGRLTGTLYYNIAQGWNAQMGGRFVLLNGGNLGYHNIAGVFVMLGYSYK